MDAKKEIQSGASVSKSWDIDTYYSLFQQTFEHQGLKAPVPKGYLDELCKQITTNDLGEMWVAKTPGEQWIAAEIFLCDNKFVHRWTAATDPELRANGGYHLLLDTAFQNYLDKGMSTVNLMAANTPQLTEFITGFNPYLCPYFVVSKNPSMTTLASKTLW